MRYLIIFMLLVAVFVVGRRWSPFTAFGVRGEGPVVTETRSVADFHAVRLEMAADVTVRTGQNPGVTVHAQQNLLSMLRTEVDDKGQLRLYFDGSVSYSEDVRVEVTTRAIDGLELAGSGLIRLLDPVQADQLQLLVSGSGDIIVPESRLNAVEAKLTGSGSIKLAGSAQSFTVRILGSGDVLADSLLANTLDVEITGSGSARCDVAQAITGRISGSGDVLYTGDPTVNVQVTGSGSVQRSGARATTVRDTTAAQ